MPGIDDVAKVGVRSVFTYEKRLNKKIFFLLRLKWSKAIMLTIG